MAIQKKTELGTVTGRVLLPGGGTSPGRNAAVWLEPDKSTVPVAPLTRCVIDQRGKAFVPHVTMVTRGTTITFPNNDTVFHNVFAYFEAKRFDLGMYPRGAVKRQKFDKAGVVALLCNIHPQMSAYIVVVDTPYYALVTSGEGRFRIDGVPAGAYTLHIWHESGASLTQPLLVDPAAARDALTDFLLRR